MKIKFILKQKICMTKLIEISEAGVNGKFLNEIKSLLTRCSLCKNGE